MRTIRHEWSEVRNYVKKYVADTLNNRIRFLALSKRIPKSRIYSDDIMDVPEHLLKEVCSFMLGNDILVDQTIDPAL